MKRDYRCETFKIESGIINLKQKANIVLCDLVSCESILVFVFDDVLLLVYDFQYHISSDLLTI